MPELEAPPESTQAAETVEAASEGVGAAVRYPTRSGGRTAAAVVEEVYRILSNRRRSRTRRKPRYRRIDERLTALLLAPFIGMFIGGAIAGEAGYGWGMIAGAIVGLLVAITPY